MFIFQITEKGEWRCITTLVYKDECNTGSDNHDFDLLSSQEMIDGNLNDVAEVQSLSQQITRKVVESPYADLTRGWLVTMDARRNVL